MDTKDLQNSDSVHDEQQNIEVNSKTNEIDNLDLKQEKEEDSNSVQEAPEKEIEKSNEAETEVESSVDEKETERVVIDYTTLSREELVSELLKLIDNQPINDIRKDVEAIKASFYKKQKVLNEELRKQFLSEGGIIEDFAPVESPIEEELKDLFKRYRRLKAEFNRKQEKDKEGNLEKKYEIIEELKIIVTKDESIGDTFKEFKELQNRWKEIGQVPQQKLKDLWNTYHHHVEKFYDFININKELRDLDLKKNLEIKKDLCEKAEKLSEEKSVVTAFKTLQKFHSQWREIGPVPNEDRDVVWERFKEATRVINKKHQDYFKNLKDEQKGNLDRKEKLCEQAEEIASKVLSSHKEWIVETEAIIELQKEWRTIGFAPKKDNNKIYARFRNACDGFFGKKRDFYVQNKEHQDVNMQKKIALCEKAESLQHSTDWKETTRELIDLQKEWKEVGPVSRKQSDKIWKRFRAACDNFFNKKSEYYSNIDQEYDKNLKLKLDLIEKVKSYEFTDDPSQNFEALKDLHEEFSEVGFVPYKIKDKIQNDFREELNKQFDKLKVGESERKLLKFQTRLETLHHKPKSASKIRHERDKFFNKIKKLESDIALWENNLGFFSADSKQAQEMLKDYQKKIDDARKEMTVLEEKVRMIDRSDAE
ncbi:MAG: DUF349 domain-containing protein [Bacteroidales bacterium]|nr:DUF349 domain-containing protein [Bacteroidales bacterium]